MRHFLSLVFTYANLNLKAEAKKTYLSYLWWLLEPALYVAAFYFVFAVILDNGRADYIAFLVLGKIPFLWFSKSINGAAGTIMQNRGLLTHSEVRPELFPLVDLQQNLHKQSVVFIGLVIFVLAQGYMVSEAWVYLPLIVLLQFLLILPISLLAAWFTSFIPDTRMLIGMFTIVMMFVSGIFWDVNEVAEPMRSQILLYNPLAFIIDAYRQVLLYGNTPDVRHLGGLALVLLGCTGVILWLYKLTKSRICSKVLQT